MAESSRNWSLTHYADASDKKKVLVT